MIRLAVCHLDSAGGKEGDCAARSARIMIGFVDRRLICCVRWLVPRYGLNVAHEVRAVGVATAAGSEKDTGVGLGAAGIDAAMGVLTMVLMAVVVPVPVLEEASVSVHVAAVLGVMAAGR